MPCGKCDDVLKETWSGLRPSGRKWAGLAACLFSANMSFSNTDYSIKAPEEAIRLLTYVAKIDLITKDLQQLQNPVLTVTKAPEELNIGRIMTWIYQRRICKYKTEIIRSMRRKTKLIEERKGLPFLCNHIISAILIWGLECAAKSCRSSDIYRDCKSRDPKLMNRDSEKGFKILFSFV